MLIMMIFGSSRSKKPCFAWTLIIVSILPLHGNINSNATLIKLPTNQATIATEVTGLEINSGDISSPSACSWEYNPGLISGFLFYLSSFGGCASSTTATYSISCSVSSGVVSSNLTFLTPLTSNVSVAMACSPSLTYNLHVIVKDCTSPTPSNVPVNPPTGVYNTPAHFQCSQNSTLFYSSGTIGNTATKCLASAEWENENIVQCWSAPTATLIGNNTHYVGDKATFQCNAVWGFPLADRVEVYFNGQIQVLNGNTWTSTALTSSNDGDIVECRAISNYTSIAEYSHLGRDKKTLTVYFGAESFTVDGDPNSNGCTWYIATPGPQSCNISFSLNPATYTTSLTKNGAIVMNDANQMQTSPPTFVFLRNKPTYSDNGVYTLKIKNDKFQVDVDFSISVINMIAPTKQPITNPSYIPPPNNLGVIIGAACGGVVLLILIVVLVYCFLRKKRNKTEKDTGNTQLTISLARQEPVGSIDEDNAGYVELNALDPNLEAGTGGDNGGYETVMVKKDSKEGL